MPILQWCNHLVRAQKHCPEKQALERQRKTPNLVSYINNKSNIQNLALGFKPSRCQSRSDATIWSEHNSSFQKSRLWSACKLHRQQSNVQNYALGFKPSGRQLFNDATRTCSKHNNIFEKAGFGAATGNPKPCK